MPLLLYLSCMTVSQAPGPGSGQCVINIFKDHENAIAYIEGLQLVQISISMKVSILMHDGNYFFGFEWKMEVNQPNGLHK